MKIKNIMPILVLSLICLATAIILGGANALTKGKIRENALKKEQASLIEVLPESTIFDELDVKEYSLPKTVKSAYRESADRGYVLIMETSTEYSTEPMTASVGIYTDGTVAGVSLTSYKESKDFGKTTYPEKFVGATKESYGSVDIIAGVTVSSTAFKGLIGDALSAVEALEAGRETASLLYSREISTDVEEYTGAIPRSDSELYPYIKKLVGENDFSPYSLPEGAPEVLKRLYKISEKSEYIAYIVVPGEYVPVATEGLVYIGGNGKIKNIELLSWIVGHGVEYGNFPERFIGKNEKTVISVELVSSATYTSSDFREAVKSVFPYIPTAFPIWRALGILILASAAAAFITAMIISKKRRTSG